MAAAASVTAGTTSSERPARVMPESSNAGSSVFTTAPRVTATPSTTCPFGKSSTLPNTIRANCGTGTAVFTTAPPATSPAVARRRTEKNGFQSPSRSMKPRIW